MAFPLKVFYYNTFLSGHLGEGMVSRRFYASAQKVAGWELIAVPPFSLADWKPRSSNGRKSTNGQVNKGKGSPRQHLKAFIPSDVRKGIRNLQSPRSRVPIAPYLYTRRRKQDIAQALAQNDFDLFWLHLSQDDLATLAWLIRHLKTQFPDTPVVLRAPGPLAYQADHVFHRYMSQQDRRDEQFLYAQADAIAVISNDMKNLMVAQGVAGDKIWVLPNGIDFESFVPDKVDGNVVREKYGLNGRKVVGYIGGYWRGNDMDTLLYAWQRVSAREHEATLMLVGDGPKKAEAVALAQTLDLPNCVWIDRVPHDEVPSYLAAMDIGVGPYIKEALNFVSPLKVIEYTAMGLAVVAADGGQIRELVKHGVSGYLYSAGDSEKLAECTLDLLQNPEKAEVMRLQAAKDMRSWYTWDEFAMKAYEHCAAVELHASKVNA